MSKLMMPIVLVSLLPCLPESAAWAQFGGSRAGVEANADVVADLPMLDREVAEGFIVIDGRAEIRVRPTEIRIVLAVTSEGPTAQDCQASLEESVSKLKTAWLGLGIPAESIVEDFIAVLPLYEWNLEKRGDNEIGVEAKAGFRMQTNVHVAVTNDGKAAQALAVALEQDVTDVIAFDYWSRELDEFKLKAREQAVKAARSKADLLFTALLDSVPPVINIQEQTTIRFPDSLYHSFVNTHDAEVQSGWRRDIPFVRAYRPRNTYYRGLNSDGDVQPRDLPMHPEISVVSTVRLYFQSPAAKQAKGGKDEE
ncbi:MAG: SIMPL domain-containing protein [Planctomycetaceae bacterium]|nr:MAG: SIMPL domain-containing protein [Planctomycetaceae bacterium]